MTYFDEIILEKREQVKRETHTTLEEGVYLEGQIIQFERKKVFDIFSVMLPKTWNTLPKEYAKVKYPSEFRPQIIYTTLDLSVNMGFTVFPNGIEDDDLAKIAERAKSALNRANPDIRLYSCEDMQNIKGCWFALRSHAMDSDVYNMLLFASIKRGTVQGSFNCLYKDCIKWKKVVLSMWNSIIELKKEV